MGQLKEFSDSVSFCSEVDAEVEDRRDALVSRTRCVRGRSLAEVATVLGDGLMPVSKEESWSERPEDHDAEAQRSGVNQNG